MVSEICFEQTLQAEPEEVFRMFTNSTAMREWLANRVLSSAAPNGRLYLEWQSGYYAAGYFTEFAVPHRAAFTMQGRGEPGPSQVEVAIAPVEGGTLVKLRHSGFGEGSEWDTARKEIQRGWLLAFERLKHALEQGPDLRVTTRPMLGLLFGEFSPETAKRLGIPVEAGLLLNGTIEGLGAQKAGLQKDDLIVAINGSPTPTFDDVQKVMRGKKAGEVMLVTYYRGGDQCTVDMVLSPRPLPEIPTNTVGLAGALEKIYQHEDAEYIALLEEITEAEASFKPAEHEWSVKEVLAHLIQGERGTQNMITELFLSHETIADGFGNNVDAYIKATVETYATFQALKDAFHASRKETLRLLANLPEDFARRKSTFWKLGYQLLAFPYYHAHEHGEQIKSTIAKARN